MFVVHVRCHLSTPVLCFYLQRGQSEEYHAQLEEAASCAQVVKVEVAVSYRARASRSLAAGFSRNSVLREVTLNGVPKTSVESVRGTLCTNTALTVNVRSTL